MIRFEEVTVRYDGAAHDALRGVDLVIPEGELCLVVGPTGVGKSTLLGLVNGSVPHFTGGTVGGRVVVDGRDTRDQPPRELADVVGVVAQDPVRGFVTDRVVDELAFTMESLALPPAVMRRRVEDVVDLLGLEEFRERPLSTLSGGQQQRVAIGAALTAHPRVLVLDEPTSALDPAAAEEVLAALHRLVHDLGVTVLLAEHRLERVLGTADSVLLLPAPGQAPRFGPPAEMMAVSPVAPPVVQLGRWAGWAPLPLTVRDARRVAAPLRATLAPPIPDSGGAPTTEILRNRGLLVGYARVPVAGPFDVGVVAGAVTGLMGRNGAGKSTLLWTMAGALPPVGGSVRVRVPPTDGLGIHRLRIENPGTDDPRPDQPGAGQPRTGEPRTDGVSTDGLWTDPRTLPPSRRRRLVALVPQQPADLLYRTTVGAELDQADADAGAPAGTAGALLGELAAGIDPAVHPRDLSEGQRLALVLAVQLTGRPAVLLLDEPTRGLDYPAKDRLRLVLHRLAAAGTAVVLASHDVEFVAAACDRVLMMAGGTLIADGPTAEVLTASPTYAPQVAKILAPLPLLTVADVVQGAADHRDRTDRHHRDQHAESVAPSDPAQVSR